MAYTDRHGDLTGVIPEECVHMAKLREFKVDFITDLKSESVDFTTEAISIVPVASQKSNLSNLYTTPRFWTNLTSRVILQNPGLQEYGALSTNGYTTGDSKMTWPGYLSQVAMLGTNAMKVLTCCIFSR